jgi:hypothetical protein
METITKVCVNCNQEFQAPLPEHKRGHAKFCSLKCSTKYHGNIRHQHQELNAQCAQCGKFFHKSAYQQTKSKSGLFFCSRKCKDSAQRIGGIQAIQPSHYGTGNGLHTYRDIAFKYYPQKCMRCGYDANLAAIIVHHKDRDRTNNTPENLEVLCCNCHAIEHWS